MSEHQFTLGDNVACDPAETPPQPHGSVYITDHPIKIKTILSPTGGCRGLCIHPSAPLSDRVLAAVSGLRRPS